MHKLGYLKCYFVICFVIFNSCSSDDSSPSQEIIEEEEEIPVETRHFVSKITVESTNSNSDIYYYQYDIDNNLTTITKNQETVNFIYQEGKIARAEVIDNNTNELKNYANFYYENGKLDFLEDDFYLSPVVKYEYENDRISRIFNYSSLENFNNGIISNYYDPFYDGETKNVVEFKQFRADGYLRRRSTFTHGEINNFYLGEAVQLINLPYGNNIFRIYNYSPNYVLESWITYPKTDNLYKYKEYSFTTNEENLCESSSFIYYNSSGFIVNTINIEYEYIELEVN